MSAAPADDARKALRGRLVWLVLALLALVALAAAWTWSPMRAWLDVDRIVDTLQRLGQAFGPVAAVAGFGLAVTLAVPLTFLSLVTLVAFGPWAGFTCCMLGALIGAAASHGLGRLLGHEVVQRLGGPRVNAISQRLASHGLLAVIAIRVVPVAPFAIINMVAGASHISLRDMLLGTALGMAPGTLVMAFFVDQIVAALRTPGPLTYALLGLTLLLLVGAGWGARHWVRRVEAQRAAAAKGSG
ncbi:TVP38/TMEM64 family protein [Pseudorhodoferax sp. Leaf267]|uniref:TVP38/TMEM64 family protein n=1 Tax=Pseudorhodoferax sp. Leaf267 TaxID=1736316 RepID=UPI0006FA0831|nr:VTT domain-containing protein [Pseudorhodoferax sp. Leaf267]KQP17973.1 hypothetical protein ASF43_08915 [Pseudorhodoferax sp. Leaf267]